MKNVKVMLAKFNNISVNFTKVEFNYKESLSEVSNIIRMQKNKDIDGLLGFWKIKDKQEYFELEHPVSSIKTKAFYNHQFGLFNYVFMIDENGENFWIIVQSGLCIHSAILDDVIYTNDLKSHVNLTQLFNLDLRTLNIKPKPYGYLLSQTRPYHYFYDHLKIFIHLNSSKSVDAGNSYFIPNSCSAKESDGQVFLFPATREIYDFSQRRIAISNVLNENMEEVIYTESMNNFKKTIGRFVQDADFSIWLGITGQKRSWLQQIDGYISIIKQLNLEFQRIKVYIDGWTAPDGQTIRNADDEDVFEKIKSGLKDYVGIELISLIGQDYRTKICYCSTVDVFIANSGTGSTVPLRFNKKPGVLHRNTRLFTYNDNYPDTILCTDSVFIEDVNLNNEKLAQFFSYHTPWQHVFNLAAEVINKVKSTSIQFLEVPPIDKLIQEYKSHNYKIKPMKDIEFKAFKNLNSVITPKHEGADILREVALAFEESGDISTALTIMQKALQIRPSGPFIKKKVAEYLQKLEAQ